MVNKDLEGVAVTAGHLKQTAVPCYGRECAEQVQVIEAVKERCDWFYAFRGYHSPQYCEQAKAALILKIEVDALATSRLNFNLNCF